MSTSSIVRPPRRPTSSAVSSEQAASKAVQDLSNLELLILAQAVYEFGADSWSAVSRLLSKHPLISRHKHHFTSPLCFAIYKIIMEKAGLEISEANNAVHAPVNLRLAQKYYQARFIELRDQIAAEEAEFKRIAAELEQIRSGAWDAKISGQATEVEPPSQVEEVPIEPLVVEAVPSPKQASQKHEDPSPSPTEIEGVVPETTSPPVIEVFSPEVEEIPTRRSVEAVTDSPKDPSVDPLNELLAEPSQSSEDNHLDPHTDADIFEDGADVVPRTEESEGPVEGLPEELMVTETDALTDTDEVEDVVSRVEPDHEPTPEVDGTDTPEVDDRMSISPIAIEDEEQLVLALPPKSPSAHASTPAPISVNTPAPASSPLLSPVPLPLPSPSPSPAPIPAATPSVAALTRGATPAPPSTPAPAPATATVSTPASAPSPMSLPAPAMSSASPEPVARLDTGMGKRKASDVDTPFADSTREKKKAREESEPIQEDEPGQAGPSRRRIKDLSPEDQLASKRFQTVINMVHSQISQHRSGNIFHNPIKKTEAPDYHEIVKRPMDLKTIKARVKDGLISNSLEFQRDVYLMFANAIMYNRPGSDIYQMAEEMMLESESHINSFRQTEGLVRGVHHT